MKKYTNLLAVFLMLFTVVLVGCNNQSPEVGVEADVNPEAEIEVNEGVVYNADSWKEIIPEDCVYFFDGCNNCSRIEGEEGAVCTKMFCEKYEEPRCTEAEIEVNEGVVYNADSWKEIIPEDCVYFFDGCNNCSRIEGEEGAVCTKMFCEKYEEPRCTDDEIDEQLSDEEWSEENGEVLDGTENDTIMLDIE